MANASIIMGGFKGYAFIGGAQVLATGGNISKSKEPIISSGVAGFELKDVTNSAYSNNYSRFNGSVSYDLIGTEGTGGVPTITTPFSSASTLIIGNTTTGFKLSNGSVTVEINGVLTDCSYSASMDSNVTGDVSFIGPTGDTFTAGTATKKIGQICIPYWMTKTSQSDTIDWTCSLTRSYTPIKCLNADQTLPTHPDYYVAGLLDGSGSCTLLANTNNTDLDTLLALSDFTFYIGTANLKFNGIIVNSAATDIVGAGDQTVVSLDIVTLGSTAGVVVS